MKLSLEPEWLAWDEIRPGDSLYLDVYAANLVSGETITVTLGLHARGNIPLARNNVIIWIEAPRSLYRLRPFLADRR